MSTEDGETASSGHLRTSTTRELTADEREVIDREARSYVVGKRVLISTFGVLTSAMLGLVAFNFFRSGSWLGWVFVPVVALVGLVAFFQYGILRKVSPNSLVCRSYSHCECRIEGSGKTVHRVYYVDQYRVQLRPGWREFWPEGQSAWVELSLFHSERGLAIADALLVSLPGITLGHWLRRPPPNLRVTLWTVLAALGFLGSLVLAEILISANIWADAASALRNLGKVPRFANVTELLHTRDALRTEVVIARSSLVSITERGTYLCDLRGSAREPLATALLAPIPETNPPESEIRQEMIGGCDRSIIEHYVLRGLVPGSTAYQMAVRTVDDICRRQAIRQLDLRYRDARFRQQQERLAHLAQQLDHGGTYACLRVVDSHADHTDIAPVENQRGIWLPERDWRNGAKNTSLTRFAWLAGALVGSALTLAVALRKRRQQAAAMEDWAQKIRIEHTANLEP